MRPRIVISFSAAFLVALASGNARATDCSGIYSPCIDGDIFWPHAGPSRFVAVGSSETVGAQQVGVGLVTTYQKQPLVLHVAQPGPGGSDQNAIDDQVNGTFLWAYGVTDRLELDLAVPLTFIQSGAGLSPLTGGNALKDTAVRDMRFGLTYAIVPHSRVAPQARPEAFGLAARLEVSAPTGDSDQLAGERSGVFVPSIAADWRLHSFFAGAEVGARLRPTTELDGARIGSQLVTALGVGVDILPRELFSATLEGWALPNFAEQHDVSVSSFSLVSTPNGKYIAPAEWQLAVRTAPLPTGDLSVQLGGGGGLPITSGAPTMPLYRITLGVRWAPTGRPVAHPSSAPPPPPSANTPPAVDLHLAGAKDVCTSEPDLVDGFKDNDGCPDEDQDKDGIPDRLDQCPLVPEDFVGLGEGCPEKQPAPKP
jgi:hypothetical protein